jgi:hypothetical protein
MLMCMRKRNAMRAIAQCTVQALWLGCAEKGRLKQDQQAGQLYVHQSHKIHNEQRTGGAEREAICSHATLTRFLLCLSLNASTGRFSGRASMDAYNRA